MQRKNFLGIILTAALGTSFFLGGCASRESIHGYKLPSSADFEGYTIVDGVDKWTVSKSVDRDEKVALVVRDISTTSYSYLVPRYRNSMVKYEGNVNCCRADTARLGDSGLKVYKFSFIGKGETTVTLVSRQKGLSQTARTFDTDKMTTIKFNID